MCASSETKDPFPALYVRLCMRGGFECCPGIATFAGRGAIGAAAAAGATLGHSHPGQARQTGEVKGMQTAFV